MILILIYFNEQLRWYPILKCIVFSGESSEEKLVVQALGKSVEVPGTENCESNPDLPTDVSNLTEQQQHHTYAMQDCGTQN